MLDRFAEREARDHYAREDQQITTHIRAQDLNRAACCVGVADDDHYANLTPFCVKLVQIGTDWYRLVQIVIFLIQKITYKFIMH